MHRKGFMHRDIKPENLLLRNDDLVKLTDFGIVKDSNLRIDLTNYISTRWYRSPENVLRSSTYTSKVDVFAAGCVMAELYTNNPLFPGNSEFD